MVKRGVSCAYCNVFFQIIFLILETNVEGNILKEGHLSTQLHALFKNNGWHSILYFLVKRRAEKT